MRDKWLVTVARCADMERPAVPGTTTAKCQACGAKVWVAPSTKAAIKRHDAIPHWCCLPCSTLMAKMSTEPLAHTVLRESIDDALRFYGDTAANREKGERRRGNADRQATDRQLGRSECTKS